MSTEIAAPAVVDLAAYVAGEIRAHLGRHNISRAELARRLGVEETWIGKRLNGRIDISLSDLQRIAEALQVDVSALLPARSGHSTRSGITGP